MVDRLDIISETTVMKMLIELMEGMKKVKIMI